MGLTLSSRLAGLLPASIQQSLCHRYWQIKSDFLYHRLYEMLDLEYSLQSGLTLKVASKGEWWTYNDIFVNHEYDLPIIQALESRPREEAFTVLDLGANVGYFLLRVVDLMWQRGLQNLAADFTLVEGSPLVYRELQTRVAQQNLSPATLRVIHGLAGRRVGSSAIRQSALHVKNTIVQNGEKAKDAVNVDFIDLSQLMEGRGAIDLLKCDIEGSELLLVENYGDLLASVRSAVFEFHDELCDTARCSSLLQQAGFNEQVLRSSPGISVRLFSRN